MKAEVHFMKERAFDEKQNVTSTEITCRNSGDLREIGGRRNDWTNSDWLSDWLKLARREANRN